MKSFTRPRVPIEFEIDDEKFDAARAIPAQALMDMTKQFAAMDEDDSEAAMAAMIAVLKEFLLPRSYDRFLTRMSSKEEPIEFPQVQDVIFWLLEQYGMRPTQQSSGSSDGLPSPEPGTNSTGSTPDVVSISLPSPLIDS
jgi:hypothetical protein